VKTLLGVTESILDRHPVFKISTRAVPLDHSARFIAQWIGAEKEPAKFAVGRQL
jgi:hypothetical protein